MHRATSASIAALALFFFGADDAAAERGWMPPQMWIACAGGSDCEPTEIGQELVLSIAQESGTNVSVYGAQFGLAFVNLEPIELIPSPGFTNLGTMASPILVGTHPNCGAAPFEVELAQLRVRVLDPSDVSVCFVLSDQDLVACPIDCLSGQYVAALGAGFFTSETGCDIPPSDLCFDSLPVAPSTWGWIKSTYRD